MNAEALARALGWFSLGLGLAEVTAPRALGRFVGLEDQATLVRALGAREIASGVGALTHRPAPWIWARVAGDVLDLSILGSAYERSRSRRLSIMVVAGSFAAVAALDVLCGRKLENLSSRGSR